MEHKVCYYKGRTIHYQDEGCGKTLVLLHGFMNSLDVWSSFVYFFMREMRVITIDLPGHGKSENIAEVHSMELMADIVKLVLDHAKVEHCVIIGHSMGGYVASAFSVKYPQMLKGLGFLHSQVLPDDVVVKQNRERACEIVKQNRSSYIINFIPELFYKENLNFLQKEIETLKETALEMSAEGIIAAQRGMAQRSSGLENLAKVNFPVLFIFGRQDSRIKDLELAVSQAMMAKNVDISILDNVGHMGQFEATDIVKIRFKQFMERCHLEKHEPIFIINKKAFDDLD